MPFENVNSVSKIRLGIDIGGTFTDVVLLGDDGSVRTAKVLSTPDDYARGVEHDVRAARECSDVDPVAQAESAQRTAQ